MRMLGAKVVTAGVLLTLLAVLKSVSTHAQIQEPRVPTMGELLESCAPGYRIEFVLGSISLFVDPHWLGLASLTPLSSHFGADCPLRPVDTETLYLDTPIVDAANIPPDLGRPLLLFKIEKAADPRPGQTTSLSLPGAPPLKRTAEPYIEDVTRIALRFGTPSPIARVYRLVYPGNANDVPTSIQISCDGEAGTPGGRSCFTPLAYRYLGGSLTVNYRFRQDHLPVAELGQTSSPDMMRELEGVLVFDTRIRAWIDNISKKP
jgi:hypothetical protein